MQCFFAFIAHRETPIHIALCFKYGNPCDNSVESQNWIALVTSFFHNATSLIAKERLKLEFVLDGVATPGGIPSRCFASLLITFELKWRCLTSCRTCLSKLWKPWNSTWIAVSDPWEAAFSNTENNHGYDRFQILNQPETDFVTTESDFRLPQHFICCFTASSNPSFFFSL